MSRKGRKAKAELRRQKYRNLILDAMATAAKATDPGPKIMPAATKAGDLQINELINNCPQDKDVILQSARQIRDAFETWFKKEQAMRKE